MSTYIIRFLQQISCLTFGFWDNIEMWRPYVNIEAPMYHPQSHPISECCTYLDSAAQDEQNEDLHHQIPSTNFMFDLWFLRLTLDVKPVRQHRGPYVSSLKSSDPRMVYIFIFSSSRRTKWLPTSSDSFNKFHVYLLVSQINFGCEACTSTWKPLCIILQVIGSQNGVHI